MLQATRVKVLRDISLEPHTVLRKGETGKIMHRQLDGLGVYSMDVRMDRTHAGLAQWDNEAHLVAPELWELVPINASLLRANVIYLAIVAVVALTAALEALLGFL